MKQDKSLILLGIVAVLAIIGLVFLFENAISGNVVHVYPEANIIQNYPTSVARLHCELPEPHLDQTKEFCRRKGWEDCGKIHQYSQQSRISTCYKVCGEEVANICRKAYGDYGIGLKYTREPNMGLRRPFNEEKWMQS